MFQDHVHSLKIPYYTLMHAIKKTVPSSWENFISVNYFGIATKNTDDNDRVCGFCYLLLFVVIVSISTLYFAIPGIKKISKMFFGILWVRKKLEKTIRPKYLLGIIHLVCCKIFWKANISDHLPPHAHTYMRVSGGKKS